MAKQWLCDKGCSKTIQWPIPYKAGNKPVNLDGTPHNCLEGGPDHVAGQVASPPASAPPTTEQKTLKEDNKIGQSLEDKLYTNAEIITLEIWTRAQSMARTLSTSNATPDQINSLAELLASIMSRVIAK